MHVAKGTMLFSNRGRYTEPVEVTPGSEGGAWQWYLSLAPVILRLHPGTPNGPAFTGRG